MKSNELKLGVEYAIIPAWDYSSAEKKNANYVQRRDVAKAQLVSLDKYEYRVFRFDTPNNPNFQPAPKGSRSVGYMVKSADLGNGDTYWIARAQDIVAEYSSLETRWTAEEQAKKEYEEKQRIEREAHELRMRQLNEKAQNSLKSITASLTAILGAERTARVRGDISTRRNQQGEYEPYAEFLFDERTISVLIEKVLEAQDSGSGYQY